MPLLKGTFDPKKLNSTTLGREMHQADPTQFVDWRDLQEGQRRRYVDWAQRILDSLAERKIIR